MRIAVIGNGIIGLATAIKLLLKGREVIIYSLDAEQSRTEKTVSLVACALWQPYKLYKNLDEFNSAEFENIKEVSYNSLEEYSSILNNYNSDETGVYIKNHFEYSDESIYDKDKVLKKDFYYIEVLKDFWQSKKIPNGIFNEIQLNELLPSNLIDSKEQYLHGYKTYVIDPSVFLVFLNKLFFELGGTVISRKINHNELKKLNEKVVFNCSGINGFKIISSGTKKRELEPKKGVLLLYNLKDERNFENTIVIDELTILCRKNVITIGTGVVSKGEEPDVLINRLIEKCFHLLNSENINLFGFDKFIEYHNINLREPNKILIGSRPYFIDGKGYLISREEIKSKNNLSIVYNNFGHGGSGVTLCFGCANEAINLYLKTIDNKLNEINSKRSSLTKISYNIEFAHFDLKTFINLQDSEIDNLINIEWQKLNDIIQKLNLKDEDVVISVLLDEKECTNDSITINKVIKSLKKAGVDYIAYESLLNYYIDQLNAIVPQKIAIEFKDYLKKHFKLGCAQDIFVWHCLRLGIVNFNFEDNIISPVSEKAKNKEVGFVSNSIISILKKSLKSHEDKADDYISKSFGFEIATTIRRFYT